MSLLVKRYKEQFRNWNRLTGKYDKILEFTPTWISTNALFQKVGGNKAEFLRKLKDAESDGYIDMKQEGNKKFYKR